MTYSLELGPGERWFVARVLAHQENRAQFNLHRLGFRSFLPRLRRTIRHARKLRDTLNPLFPGYIFIVIDLSKQRWRSINGTFGVASLIMGRSSLRSCGLRDSPGTSITADRSPLMPALPRRLGKAGRSIASRASRNRAIRDSGQR